MSPRRPITAEPLLCSFCNKSENDVQKMVAGPNGVAICDECIDVCNDIVADTPEAALPQRERHQASAMSSKREEHTAADSPPDDEPPQLFSFRCPSCGHRWKLGKKR
jgi:hypothetical protein